MSYWMQPTCQRLLIRAGIQLTGRTLANVYAALILILRTTKRKRRKEDLQINLVLWLGAGVHHVGESETNTIAGHLTGPYV